MFVRAGCLLMMLLICLRAQPAAGLIICRARYAVVLRAYLRASPAPRHAPCQRCLRPLRVARCCRIFDMRYARYVAMRLR